MPEYTLQSDYASVIAIDQHARSVTACALDLASGETRTGRLSGCPSAGDILEWSSWTGEPRRFVYDESAPFLLTGCYAASAAFFDILAP